MHDDEVDDRWLALAALLLGGIETSDAAAPGDADATRPNTTATPSDAMTRPDATVTRLDAARPGLRGEREAARRRHPCLHERSA